MGPQILNYLKTVINIKAFSPDPFIMKIPEQTNIKIELQGCYFQNTVFVSESTTQQTFRFSKSTSKTPKKVVNMFKVIIKTPKRSH